MPSSTLVRTVIKESEALAKLRLTDHKIQYIRTISNYELTLGSGSSGGSEAGIGKDLK